MRDSSRLGRLYDRIRRHGGWLCSHHRQERLDTEDVYDAREIVGEHVQGHLGRNLRQSLHQEVGRTHPHLERAKGMLGRLAAHTHRTRVLVETLLHRFEHMLVLPSRDAPLRTRRAASFERAVRACRRPIATQRLAVLLVGVTMGQLVTCRAAIDILGRQIDEVLLAETAIRLRARCHPALAASP
jgi:hypothetical protein